MPLTLDNRSRPAAADSLRKVARLRCSCAQPEGDFDGPLPIAHRRHWSAAVACVLWLLTLGTCGTVPFFMNRTAVPQPRNSLDVNGDGAITPCDAIAVIEAINAQSAAGQRAGSTGSRPVSPSVMVAARAQAPSGNCLEPVARFGGQVLDPQPGLTTSFLRSAYFAECGQAARWNRVELLQLRHWIDRQLVVQSRNDDDHNKPALAVIPFGGTDERQGP